MVKATCIIVDGPEGAMDRWGDEVPEWFVGVCDDAGEPIGEMYRVRSWDGALKLGQDMARDRRLELVVDGTPE